MTSVTGTDRVEVSDWLDLQPMNRNIRRGEVALVVGYLSDPL